MSYVELIDMLDSVGKEAVPTPPPFDPPAMISFLNKYKQKVYKTNYNNMNKIINRGQNETINIEDIPDISDISNKEIKKNKVKLVPEEITPVKINKEIKITDEEIDKLLNEEPEIIEPENVQNTVLTDLNNERNLGTIRQVTRGTGIRTAGFNVAEVLGIIALTFGVSLTLLVIGNIIYKIYINDDKDNKIFLYKK